MTLTRRLARAEYTIADDYLSGRVGREESIERLMKYTLASRERATQRLRFIDTYRSYIINYGLGRDLVHADAGEAFAREQPLGRVQNGGTLAQVLGPAGAGGLGCGFLAAGGGCGAGHGRILD